MTTSDALLVLEPGVSVLYRGQVCHIRRASTDFLTISLYEPDSGQFFVVPISELKPVVREAKTSDIDVSMVPEERWQEAVWKFQVIQPLLEMRRRTKQDVAERAKEFDLHPHTLYRWMNRYETTGKVTAFLRVGRPEKGITKLPEAVEKIIRAAIKNKFLTLQQGSMKAVHKEVKTLCKAAGITKVPHYNTIVLRIRNIDASKKTRARRGGAEADKVYGPIQGHFPGAETPLAVVQVDHTLLDIILVDDIHRLPVGRPWITLIIDVFSRMVLGFYISFDPPGNLSLGLSLAHAILPKEVQLHKLDIQTPWPCWGLPKTIHADNAKEFRGNMLKRACEEYQINLEWRPVARPHYGAHIERYLGTLNGMIHELPGTTFSNPDERGDYDSDGKAILTIKEFERWLTIRIVEEYHQDKHSGIGMPPIEKWKQGILGTKTAPGIGLPPRISDEQRLKHDLMPFEERTVQDYGIVWDNIYYQHDVLRRWINATEPDDPKHKRKFLCRRDPRDISVIWFYDPEVKLYYPIPYRDTSHPAISVWELREARRRAEEESPEVDEQAIFQAHSKIMAIEEEARGKTKRVRRQEQRRRLGLENSRDHIPRIEPAPVKTPDQDLVDRPSAVILPFDDLDDMSDD